MIESFASGATASMVVKSGTKKLFYYCAPYTRGCELTSSVMTQCRETDTQDRILTTETRTVRLTAWSTVRPGAAIVEGAAAESGCRLVVEAVAAQ